MYHNDRQGNSITVQNFKAIHKIRILKSKNPRNPIFFPILIISKYDSKFPLKIPDGYIWYQIFFDIKSYGLMDYPIGNY